MLADALHFLLELSGHELQLRLPLKSSSQNIWPCTKTTGGARSFYVYKQDAEARCRAGREKAQASKPRDAQNKNATSVSRLSTAMNKRISRVSAVETDVIDAKSTSTCGIEHCCCVNCSTFIPQGPGYRGHGKTPMHLQADLAHLRLAEHVALAHTRHILDAVSTGDVHVIH